MANEFGTLNHFGVGTRGEEVTILRNIRGAMSKDAAINLAVYLVLCANGEGEFNALIKAVKET